MGFLMSLGAAELQADDRVIDLGAMELAILAIARMVTGGFVFAKHCGLLGSRDVSTVVGAGRKAEFWGSRRQAQWVGEILRDRGRGPNRDRENERKQLARLQLFGSGRPHRYSKGFVLAESLARNSVPSHCAPAE